MTNEEIKELLDSWYKEDEKNRCFFLVMSDRNNIEEYSDYIKHLLTEKDNNGFMMMGKHDNLFITLGTAIKMSHEFRNVVLNSIDTAVRMDCDMYKLIDND